MPYINLLPWREQRKKQKQKNYIMLLVLTFILALFIVFVTNYIYKMRIENQEYRNQYLSTEIATLDAKIKAIKDIKTKRENLQRRMVLISDLQRNRNLGAQIMNEFVNVVPTGIYLTKLDKKNSVIEMSGKSESNNRVSDMMRQIEDSHLLETRVLNSITTSNKKNSRLMSQFSMSVNLKKTDSELSTKETK